MITEVPHRVIRPDVVAVLNRRKIQLEGLSQEDGIPFRDLIERAGYLIGVQVKALENLAPIDQVLMGQAFFGADQAFPWHSLVGFITDALNDTWPWHAAGTDLKLHAQSDWARQVARILQGEAMDVSPELTPLLVSAIQLIWMQSAVYAPVHDAAETHLCPLCLGLPVASLRVRGERQDAGRYFSCGLCSTIWPRPRLGCALCGDVQSQILLSSSSDRESVQLEICQVCNVYVKRFDYLPEEPMDPLAQDLSTLALDLLASEQGYRRMGLNYLLIDAFSV